MHKLLKAKQDLIDIQKKRIEHLSTRGHPNNLTSLMNKSISNIQYQQQNYEDTNTSLVIKNMNKMSNMNVDDVKLNNAILSTASKINPSQVAASPSSSSSSMTQFCKYLTANNLKSSANTLDEQTLSNYNRSKTERMPSPTRATHLIVDGSSTSSSSSALSTSSSLNHLNLHQNQTSNFNFFRTSEL